MCTYILIKSFGSTQKTQLILTTTTVFTVFAVFSSVVENTRLCFIHEKKAPNRPNYFLTHPIMMRNFKVVPP